MANDASKAEFWKEFLCARSEFPASEKLRAQFANAEITEVCQCGCNSFGLKVLALGVPPIASPGKYGPVFELNFELSGHSAKDRRTVEITLFSGETGHLEYVEIHSCANSYPMPEQILVVEPPFHVHASKALMA